MTDAAARSDEARRRRDADPVAVATPAGTAPALSVVVPTHDVGPWIRETLQSLTAQTFADLEIIVVEDHSTDETTAIVAEFAARDDRIRVLHPQGRGGAHARNVGVAHAGGTWLAFCDGDDIVPERAYAALMAGTRDSASDLVIGDFLKYRPHRTWRPAQRAGTFAEDRTGCTLEELPQIIRHRACWNKVFRRDAWQRLDLVFPEVVRSNDIVPMVQAYLAADGIDIVTDVTYIYRDRPGASSMTSGVGSTASLTSYLEQELVCAALLAETGSSALKQEHDWILLNADLWVQLSEYLLRLDGRPAEPEVVGLVSTLLARVDASAWSPDTVPQLRRRWALTLCATGQLDTAARVLHLTTKDRPVDDAVAEIAAWADVLDDSAAATDFRAPAAHEIFDRWLPRRIRAAEAADAAAAAAVVRRLDRHRGGHATGPTAPPARRGLLGRLRGRR
jgi:hypothetical protein